MEKKEFKKLFRGEMDSYEKKLVIRFMSEQATAQAYSYLSDHIRGLKLTGDDDEKLPWANRQADNLSSKAMNECMRHSNIAYGIKIALKDICDELAVEVYEDYAMLIVDDDTLEIDPYTYVAECGVSILDDPIKSFAKLRKKYLELADKISKAKADLDNAKDDGMTAKITTPDSKHVIPDKETMEWMGAFEDLVQNVNAEESSNEASAEDSPEEVLTEEAPAEEEESHE